MCLPKALILEISRQCADELSRQVASRAASMPTSELRGYVRARARSMVRERAVDAGRNDRRAAAHVDELIDAAIAQTVHFVLSAYQSSPMIDIQAPHIGESQPISIPMWAAQTRTQQRRAAA
jgi:hypothetical protein